MYYCAMIGLVFKGYPFWDNDGGECQAGTSKKNKQGARKDNAPGEHASVVVADAAGDKFVACHRAPVRELRAQMWLFIRASCRNRNVPIKFCRWPSN